MSRNRQRSALIWLTVLWLVWAGWYLSSKSGSSVTVVDDTGIAVAGAEIMVGDVVIAITDHNGRAEVSWHGSAPELDVRAVGFRPAWLVPTPGAFVGEIEPYVLNGAVSDARGRGLAGVTVRSGSASAVTDGAGSFSIRGGEPGRVLAWMPAWSEGAWSWDGSPGTAEIELAPMTIRAAHVGGDVAGNPTQWAKMVDLIERTDLNGVMLDLKDETGTVYFDSDVPLAGEVGATSVRYDLAEVARSLDERDIYLIGRIVTFQDPIVANRRFDMAVTDQGEAYSRRGQFFLDPTDLAARGYALDLAEEACRLGVDEVQFDYVRFPDGFPTSAVFDGPVDENSRVEAIRSFLAEARLRVRPTGCAVAAAVFGFTTTARDDGGIGQKWDVVAAELDVVSPMVYPSHYQSGWYGFEDPSAHPGDVVLAALTDGAERLRSNTVLRPWLQDFAYGIGRVRDQIVATESLGLGWMLWNATSDVTEGALDAEFSLSR